MVASPGAGDDASGKDSPWRVHAVTRRVSSPVGFAVGMEKRYHYLLD